MHVYIWEHIVRISYRTARLMFTKLGRDEVLIASHMRIGFSARSALGWIQGRARIGQLGATSPKDF